MNNNTNQSSSQFKNKYINNKLVNEYQQFTDNNVPYANNSMLMNNPIYFGNIRDPNFYNKVNMAKIEQMKKIKNTEDLGISKSQLINYIICPIKIEKTTKSDFNDKYDIAKGTYSDIIKKNGTVVENVPQYLKDLWSTRKNIPYKNILKNENYDKEFKTLDDLIVHKVTQLDKDRIKLENELKILENLIEKHDGELKIIYSVSEESKHKKEFEYITVYKNRLKFDPKNYNDLKNFYKKEQRKIEKENRRITDMIELLMISDQLTKEEKVELDELKKQTENDDVDINDDMDNLFEKGEKVLEEELEKKLRKELGDNEVNELLKQSDNTDDVLHKKTRVKLKAKNDSDISDNINLPEKDTKRRIKIKQKSENIIGQVNDDDIEKYRHRKKKNE